MSWVRGSAWAKAGISEPTARKYVWLDKLPKLDRRLRKQAAPETYLNKRLNVMKFTIQTSLMLFVGMMASSSVWSQVGDTEYSAPAWQPQVVIVQFDADGYIVDGVAKTGVQAFDRLAIQYSVWQIQRAYPFLDHVQPNSNTYRNLAALRRTYYVRYQSTTEPQHVATGLQQVEEVVYAEPVALNRLFDSDLKRHVDPDDPRFSDQKYLQHMRLPEAWDEVKGMDGSPRVVIAIVDGGGDWQHEDLLGNVWTNAGDSVANGLDDDNNGFIDDVHGVNFGNEDPANNDPTGDTHGTSSAGVASAVTDNGIGVAGAAWNAELMHVNVACPGGSLICYGYEGILYAAANGADIINTSWGGPVTRSTPLRHQSQVLELVTDMGALVVASSGNHGRLADSLAFYPAYSSARSVCWSNRG